MPGRRNVKHTQAADATLEQPLALESQDATTATFGCVYDGKAINPYNVWVSLAGYSGDSENDRVTQSYGPVRWNEEIAPDVGDSCTVTLAKGEGEPPPVRFEAFMCEFPDVWTATSNIVEFASA